MIKIHRNIIVILLVVVNCGADNYHNDNKVKSIKSIKLIENLFSIKPDYNNMCYNLKLWKRRRREKNIFNYTGDVLRIRRSPIEFDAAKEINEIKPRSRDSVYVKFKRRWPVHLWYHYDLFTDDYILMINEHWLSFPPPPPSLYYTLAGVYIVLATIGSMGNVVVIVMYIRIRRSPIEFDAAKYINEIKPRSRDSVYVKFKRRWPVHLWYHYDLFTDDYILMINEHWLSFPPPPPSLYYTLAGVYIVLATIGSMGNVVLIVMCIRCRSLRTAGNILVANLALSDFLMLAKTPIFIFNSFHLGPVLGKTGCIIYGFVGGLSGTTSIATLTAIALDRYWAVVHPLQPLRALTAIRARLLAVGSWLYAGIFATIPALDIGYGRYVPEGFLTSCSFDYLTDELKPRYFIFIFFCAGWLAPLCTISYCYTHILRVVVCQRNMPNKNQEQRMSSRHVKEQTKRKAEVKLAILVIVVIALFFASWTPYAVVALLGIFGQKHLITPITSMIPALFCKTAACINPFIYIITHPTFRKELQKLLFKDKSRRMAGTIRTTTYTETNIKRRPSRDMSETDVEVIEMKDIPYQNQAYSAMPVETVSGKVSGRTGSQRSHASMKSFEESVVTPPSWFTKPQFSKKKSFTRSSFKKSFDN